MKNPQKIREVFQNQESTKQSDYKQRTMIAAEDAYKMLLIYHQELIPDFILDEENKQTIGRVALWLAEDSRLGEKCKNGLLIRGACGTGKSKLAKALQMFQKETCGKLLKVITAKELQKMYARQDDDDISILKKLQVIVIDELGTEAVETNYFGNKEEPFNDFFYDRYNNEKITIVITNLLPSEIKSRYGERITDRMRETMNEIIFKGESKRK